ncbi:unnamed protein product [Symbiodinium sp. CCMP2456]|nr:unnamed protein product [Symbiodinium sp. CCMP2456]
MKAWPSYLHQSWKVEVAASNTRRSQLMMRRLTSIGWPILQGERVQMKALSQISSWQRFYNFRDMDVNEQQVPGPSRCFRLRRPESMCPIHVAAKHGHAKIVKSLLMARADPKRKTSRGRTALEIARKADVDGSHREAVEALEIAQGAVSLRRAIEIMGS